MGRDQTIETIPWKPRQDAEQDQSGKVIDGNIV
jgi:hypothetical protein